MKITINKDESVLIEQNNNKTEVIDKRKNIKEPDNSFSVKRLRKKDWEYFRILSNYSNYSIGKDKIKEIKTSPILFEILREKYNNYDNNEYLSMEISLTFAKQIVKHLNEVIEYLEKE